MAKDGMAMAGGAAEEAAGFMAQDGGKGALDVLFALRWDELQ